jgi:hypothetical protein
MGGAGSSSSPATASPQAAGAQTAGTRTASPQAASPAAKAPAGGSKQPQATSAGVQAQAETQAEAPAAEDAAVSTPVAVALPRLAMSVTERDQTAGGAFVSGPLNVAAGDRIDYQIVVTNTSSVPLDVLVDDVDCHIRGGATLHFVGVPFGAGQKLTYHCSQVMAKGTRPLYASTVTVGGRSATASVPTVSRTLVAHVAQVLAAHKAVAHKASAHKAVAHKVVKHTATPKVQAKAAAPKVAKHVTKVTKQAKAAKPVVKRASFTG